MVLDIELTTKQQETIIDLLSSEYTDDVLLGLQMAYITKRPKNNIVFTKHRMTYQFYEYVRDSAAFYLHYPFTKDNWFSNWLDEHQQMLEDLTEY